MWERFKNYKYSSKELKFMLWLFGITCFVHSVAFFGGLFSSEFLWFKGLCAIAALLAFMDVKRKINKYKIAMWKGTTTGSFFLFEMRTPSIFPRYKYWYDNFMSPITPAILPISTNNTKATTLTHHG